MKCHHQLADLAHVRPKAFLCTDLIGEDVGQGCLHIITITVITVITFFFNLVRATKGKRKFEYLLTREWYLFERENKMSCLKAFLGGLPCAKNQIAGHL